MTMAVVTLWCLIELQVAAVFQRPVLQVAHLTMNPVTEATPAPKVTPRMVPSWMAQSVVMNLVTTTATVELAVDLMVALSMTIDSWIGL